MVMTEVTKDHLYEHYKGGRYLVLFIADESTNERIGNKVVVYVSLTFGVVKCRDESEFTEIVEWPDGSKKQRFIPVG